MTSDFSQLKYLSLSLSLSPSYTHSLMLSQTVSLQSLPSKEEAVGGNLPPPHNESIQSASEEKHLTGSALSSHKTKKGKRETERKKRLVRGGTRNSPYCKRAVSWQKPWLSRDVRVSMKEMEMAHVEPTFAKSCLHILKSKTKIVKKLSCGIFCWLIHVYCIMMRCGVKPWIQLFHSPHYFHLTLTVKWSHCRFTPSLLKQFHWWLAA